MNTYKGFIQYYNEKLPDKPSHLRTGQHFFICLSEYSKGMADRISVTKLDPFYSDSRMDACLFFLANNWQSG